MSRDQEKMWEQSPPAKLNNRIMDTSLIVPVKDGDKIYLAGTVKLGKRELKKYLTDNYEGAVITNKLEEATLIVFGMYANTAPYRPVGSYGTGYQFRNCLKFEVKNPVTDLVTAFEHDWYSLKKAYDAYTDYKNIEGKRGSLDDFYATCMVSEHTASFAGLPEFNDVVNRVSECYNEFQLGLAVWKYNMSKREIKLTEHELENILYMIRTSDNEVLANSFLTNMDISDYIAELILVIGARFRPNGGGDKSVFNAFSKSIPYITYLVDYPTCISPDNLSVIDQLVKARNVAKVYDTTYNIDNLIDVYMNHLDTVETNGDRNRAAKYPKVESGVRPYHLSTPFLPFVSTWHLYAGMLSILPDDMLKEYVDSQPFAYLLDSDDTPLEISNEQVLDKLAEQGAAIKVYTAIAHTFGLVSKKRTPSWAYQYEFNDDTEKRESNAKITSMLFKMSAGYANYHHGDLNYIYRTRAETNEQKLFEEHLPVMVTNFVLKNIDYMRSYFTDGDTGATNRKALIKELGSYSCLYRNIEIDRIQEYINKEIRDYVKAEIEAASFDPIALF